MKAKCFRNIKERVELKMKNVKDKLIISAAVGFTAASTITTSNLTPVFAKENVSTGVIKEDVEAKKTKKEKLEDSVKTAKSNLDDVKKVTDEKKADADAAKKRIRRCECCSR